QTSPGILPGQEVRIASKPEKLVGVKTPKRELTFARLSSIEIKLKRFLKVRRDRAPAKPDSWSSGGGDRRPRRRRCAGKCRDTLRRAGGSPGLRLGRTIAVRSKHGHRRRQNRVETAIQTAFGRHPGSVSRPWLRTICG